VNARFPTALLSLALALAHPLAGAADPARRVFADSVREITAASSPGVSIVRTWLTQDELAAQAVVSVSLRMRNLEGLRARLARGENMANGRISAAEWEAAYLPPAADYAAVRAWLLGQGLQVVQDDANHTTVFARGSVAQLAEAFQVSYARVSTSDGDFTSAVTPPSLPSSLPPAVLSIDGLQPHLRAHPPLGGTAQAGHSTGLYVAPSDVRAAYNVPAALTGAGQTIAIIMSATVSTSDLQQFWSTTGAGQAIGNFTVITVNGGPDAAEQSSLGLEAAIDVEWSSAVAPAARIRLYAIPDLLFSSVNQACIRILNDASSIAGLDVASMSIAGPEDQVPVADYEGYSQTFAQMAVAGITSLACSGDGGSNPNPDLANGYGPSFALSVEYPASDPYVTGVGGTTLTFSSSWAAAGETTWSTIATSGSGTGGTTMASGGGISAFSRQEWQTDGEAVLAANLDQRCVPDVSAMSMALSETSAPAGVTYGALVLAGTLKGCYGTSLATPIWAAVVALINQERASNGAGALGLLGPSLYPLHGTGAFNDITTGGNGAYAAGNGYDLCTGLGTPNVAHLAAALSGSSGSPPAGAVTAAAPSPPLAAGSPLSLSASASGTGPVSYQWSLNGQPIPGATAASYAITAGAEDAGSYTVTLSNASGSTTLAAGTLSVSTNAWLSNLAARAYVQGGADLLIAGFATTGPSAKTVLLRGDGPSLAQFQISGFLASPQLALFNSAQQQLAETSSWDPALAAVFHSVGAYAFPPGSADTALLETFGAGAYTAEVSTGGSASGVGEAEIYDADAGAPASRLVNLSARAFVGTGANVLIGGFVIAGTTSETVVVRGIGPGLSAFGLSGLLSNPVLEVYDNAGNVLARNAGWGNPVTSSGAAAEAASAAEFSHVGAFALTSSSADSAVVLTLPPGNYTAVLAGAAGSPSPTGVGLVEVYELR
jgi:kumamolisin